jgi:hypothetical protein
MTAIPTNADALLTRKQTAAALTEAGFKTAPATLASKATRGGGPPYQLFGRIPLYRWAKCLEWANSKLSAARCSSSEADFDTPPDRTQPRRRGRHVEKSRSAAEAS